MPAVLLSIFCSLYRFLLSVPILTYISPLFLPVKAVCAHFAGFDPDRRDQVVQPVESERGEILDPADLFHHLRVFTGIRVRVFFQHLFRAVRPFSFLDDPSRDQIKI